MLLTVLAASTRITAGSHLIVDLDPHETVSKYLAVFRASGRLFWVPYYVILAAILVTAFAVWRPKKAAVLVAVALVVQFADILPLLTLVRNKVDESHPLPFRSQYWSSLGTHYANLLVFPPWQCGNRETPGGDDGFRIFGFLAVSQYMSTNSYYAARHSPGSLSFHCDRASQELLEKPLAPDSIYVVSPSVARLIAAGPAGPDACHTVDGFILCSARTDLTDAPTVGVGLPENIPTMYASGRIEAWIDAEHKGFFVGNWQPAEADGVWSKGHATILFRLSAAQRKQYHSVSLRLMVPVGPRGVQYRIKLGSQAQSGTFPGNSVARLETFEARVPLQDAPDGLQQIVLVTKDAVRPIDIGLNGDARILGLGVLAVTLEP